MHNDEIDDDDEDDDVDEDGDVDDDVDEDGDDREMNEKVNLRSSDILLCAAWQRIGVINVP